MLIFTDPKRQHQVMALYSHDTGTTAWVDLGYERHELEFNADVDRLARDCYVVFGAGGAIVDVVERANLIQPRD